MAAARSILIGSLGCNLLLAGWVAARWTRPALAPAPDAAPAMVASAPTPRIPLSNAVAFVTNQVQAVFPWARLETNDFRAYAANLRAVGCPELTLRHILLPDLEKAYAARQRSPDASETFWVTHAEVSARHRAREERNLALEAEKRALMRELTGVEWGGKAREAWVDDEEGLPLLLGFLPDDQALRLIDGMAQLEQLKQRIQHEVHGIFGEDDEPALRQHARAAGQTLLASLAPAEAEELALRVLDGLQGMESFFDDRRRHRGLELSGTELRQLVQWSAEGRDWTTTLLFLFLGGDRKSVLEQLSQERPPGFQARARSFLGEARYAAYVRAQDPEFQKAAQVADRAGLPESAAIQAHALRQAVLARAAELGADPALGEQDRRAALARIDQETRAALDALYGPKAAEGLARDLQKAAAQAASKGNP